MLLNWFANGILKIIVERMSFDAKVMKMNHTHCAQGCPQKPLSLPEHFKLDSDL